MRSSSDPAAAAQIVEIAEQLADTDASDPVCEALEKGQLHLDSTGPIRSRLASGNPGTEQALRALQRVWGDFPELSGLAWALALRAVVAALADRNRGIAPQVVWTGPPVLGSYLRATREVVFDVLAQARADILLVGYWVTPPREHADTMERIVEALAAAVKRGVSLTLILDERRRPDGQDNRGAILGSWPSDVREPTLMTWKLPAHDQHLKLHAKVLVADRSQALVTSANLTAYAMEKNMEMGVFVRGTAAAWITDHFDRLIRQGTIVSF